MSIAIHLSLGSPGEPVDLLLLEQLAEALRGTFRELIRERTGDGKVQMSLRVRDASKGSINLVLEPEIAGMETAAVDQVTQSLIDDINDLGEGHPRSTMSSGLLNQYRGIVGIARKAGRLEVKAGQNAQASINSGNLVSLEANLKEEPTPDTRVVGRIESVNIHRKPWTCGVYTKLDQERVECRFDETMLDQVLALLESKAWAEIVGEGRYGPVGTTPRQVEMQEPPRALVFDPQALRAFRRSANIVRVGERTDEALLRIREERAPYG